MPCKDAFRFLAGVRIGGIRRVFFTCSIFSDAVLDERTECALLKVVFSPQRRFVHAPTLLFLLFPTPSHAPSCFAILFFLSLLRSCRPAPSRPAWRSGLGLFGFLPSVLSIRRVLPSSFVLRFACLDPIDRLPRASRRRRRASVCAAYNEVVSLVRLVPEGPEPTRG